MSDAGSPGPLLSIVVPTRNRVRYVTSAIRSILSIQSDQLELVVQDSSDSNSLQGCVDSLCDPRLRYHYVAPPLSAVENFNAAARQATGEYVCFIGDDDGVNPEILTATEWARANHLDALTPTLPALYYWPDFETKYRGRAHAGRLYIGSFSGARSYPNMETEMRKCIRGAGQTFAGMPKVYYGIVRRRVLEEVFKRTGLYFGGASPDMYGALSVAALASRTCLVDYPLILPGSSAASTAGSSAKREHKGRLESVPHLHPEVVRNWPSIVPRFYSVETVWAEAAVEALQAIGRADLVRDFNLPLLHAKCAVSNVGYLPQILSSFRRAMREHKPGLAVGSAQFAIAVLNTIVRHLIHLADRVVHPAPVHGAHHVDDVSNIEGAVQALEDTLRSRGCTFLETRPE